MPPTIPNTGLPEQWLTASMPQYPGPSAFYSASMPKPADISAAQPPESPEPTEWLVTGDMTYKCYYLDYSRASTVVSNVRPTITAAIGISSRDGTINLLAQYLRGGTVALLTKDGRTITANNVILEDLKNMSAELGLSKTNDGSYIALVKLSCASTDYRSN